MYVLSFVAWFGAYRVRIFVCVFSVCVCVCVYMHTHAPGSEIAISVQQLKHAQLGRTLLSGMPMIRQFAPLSSTFTGRSVVWFYVSFHRGGTEYLHTFCTPFLFSTRTDKHRSGRHSAEVITTLLSKQIWVTLLCQCAPSRHDLPYLIRLMSGPQTTKGAPPTSLSVVNRFVTCRDVSFYFLDK